MLRILTRFEFISWLRQKIVQFDVLRSVYQTISASLLIQFVNVGTGVITAHALAPQGRGELAAITMWPGFLAYTLTFGVPISLLYCIRKEPQRSNELVGAALVIGFISGCLAILIGFVCMPTWLKHYPPRQIEFARLALLTSPLTSVGMLLTAAALSEHKLTRYNQFRLLPPLLALTGLCGLLLSHHLTPILAACVYIFSGLPGFIWSGFWVGKMYRPILNNFSTSSWSLLGYGARAWGSDLIGTISDQVDRVLVVSMLFPSDMGLYVVALSSARVLGIVPGAISTALFARLVTLGPAKGGGIFLTICFIILLGMAAAALPLVAGAHYLLGLVYGERFWPATGVFRVLAVEAIFGGVTWMLAQGMSAFGHPGKSSVQQLIGLVTAIPVLFFLVPKFGLLGAGYAILFSTLVRFCFAIASYRILFNITLSSLLKTWRNYRSVLSAMSKNERLV